MFEQYIGEENVKIIFTLLSKDEFYSKYFEQLRHVDEKATENDTPMYKLKGLNKLFKERYEFKIAIRKFLDLGVKMSIRFLEEAKVYYKKIFDIFDSNGDGAIDF